MVRLLVLVILVCFSFATQAQPYLDLISARGLAGPDAGIWRRDGQHLTTGHAILATNLPLRFNKGKDAIILNPYGERWNIDYEAAPNYSFHLLGLGLPIGWNHTINTKWSFLAMFILRYHTTTSQQTFDDSNQQLGGLGLVTRQFNPKLAVKLGLYYNREFFGNFFIPLVGLDWRPNKRDRIFGTMPNFITWEHDTQKRFRYGALLRFVTFSYHLDESTPAVPQGQATYIRLQENQLTAYGDYYLTKNLVFSLEAGHTILRRHTLGSRGKGSDWTNEFKTNDGFIFRANLNYRLRFDK
jgi:Domain of unknown function (DUF6268)